MVKSTMTETVPSSDSGGTVAAALSAVTAVAASHCPTPLSKVALESELLIGIVTDNAV